MKEDSGMQDVYYTEVSPPPRLPPPLLGEGGPRPLVWGINGVVRPGQGDMLRVNKGVHEAPVGHRVTRGNNRLYPWIR